MDTAGECDGGRDGPCSCPTSRPRFLDDQHDLTDDRGDRGAGRDDEERDVWNAQITHPLLVRVLVALPKEQQIAGNVLQRSKQARIHRETEQAGIKRRPVPRARCTARTRGDLRANAKSTTALAIMLVARGTFEIRERAQELSGAVPMLVQEDAHEDESEHDHLTTQPLQWLAETRDRPSASQRVDRTLNGPGKGERSSPRRSNPR